MINPPMQYSQPGLMVTERGEGCVLKPYQDQGGVWTDGYGNTHGVVPNGPPITPEQAAADLMRNVQSAVNTVNSLVTVPVSQNQFDALVDFTFNVGATAFANSTLLRLLNSGDYGGADAEFAKWDLIRGKKSAGLDNRRAAEAGEFEGGGNTA